MQLDDLVPALPFDKKVFAFYSFKGGVGRTMGLANVAALLSKCHAKANRSRLRILCMDLDLEAPNLHVFLPPEPERESTRGFLGLLADHPEPSPDADKDGNLRDWLRPRLDPQARKGGYLYPVAGTSNLYVLPAGSVTREQRKHALARLHSMQEAVRDPERAKGSRAQVPFIKLLREVLLEHYTYALVDSRTGLADSAFATTALLADAMVLFFRANDTQLVGISDVFTRFLKEHELKATDEDVPAIPVLSPRPACSAPRIADFRKKAIAGVFRWLDKDTGPAKSPRSHYAPASRQFVEIPFDTALDIGEALLVPVDPEKEVGDPEAPLYKAYLRLLENVQALNARHDPQGAKHIERVHYHANRTPEAFKFLLARIAMEPEETEHWADVEKGYRTHLDSHPGSRAAFWDFATKVSERCSNTIAGFHSELCLRMIFPQLGLGFVKEKIARAWQTAKSLRIPTLLRLAAWNVAAFHYEYPMEASPGGIPAWTSAGEASCLADLLARRSRSNTVRCLDELGTVYARDRVNESAFIEVQHDVLPLLSDDRSRANALVDLGRTFIGALRVREALENFRAASESPDAPAEAVVDYRSYASRVGTERLAKSAQVGLPAYERDRWQLILDIRHRRPVDAVRKHIRKFGKGMVDAPWFECYALAAHGLFAEAADLGARHIGDKKESSPKDLFLQEMLEWLAGRRKFDPAEAQHFLRAQARLTGALGLARTTILALAAAPLEMPVLAQEKLQQPMHDLDEFVWALLACTSREGWERLRGRVREFLQREPLLALALRRSEDFPLVRFVWRKHREDGTIDERDFKGFDAQLNEIESWEVQPVDEVRALDFPEPITSDDDPRLEEIRQKWIDKLQRVREDPELAPVIDIMLEPAKQGEEEEMPLRPAGGDDGKIVRPPGRTEPLTP